MSRARLLLLVVLGRLGELGELGRTDRTGLCMALINCRRAGRKRLEPGPGQLPAFLNPCPWRVMIPALLAVGLLPSWRSGAWRLALRWWWWWVIGVVGYFGVIRAK